MVTATGISMDELLAPEGWPYASSRPTAPADPGRFHALFGRDSLITSLQVLSERPEVARATLRALAALQGVREDPETNEEPGKIVHEHWARPPAGLVEAGWPVRDGEIRYYGSADSTAWFLVVLAVLGDCALAGELEDAWRAAGRWLENALERGGGLLRHGVRHGGAGLLQQGWRDSIDPTAVDASGIVHWDGSVPRPPLADADSQAVAVAALRALATLTGEGRWLVAASELRARIGAAFDAETIGLDGEGRRVGGAGSQLGWLLWSDALPAQAADRAAERLCEPDILTDFGLRTLSARHPRFTQDGYHRGTVWPFDSWIGWGGLRASGRHAAAERVRTGVLDAIDRLGGAPELYAVDDEGPRPVVVANRVQAWTVGARIALEAGWDARSERT